MALITEQEFCDAKEDAETLQEVINGDVNQTAIDSRLGTRLQSIASLIIQLRALFDAGLQSAYSQIVLGGAPILSAENVGLLEVLTDMTDGQIVELKGYYQSGDGGHSTLLYRASGRSSVAINGGTYFTASGSDDYFESQEKRCVTAQQFGARGDGSGDDTLRLQAAIDWVTSIQGDLILKGRFPVSSTIILSGGLFHIEMSEKFPIGVSNDDSIFWIGVDGGTVVEANVVQRSTFSLNILGSGPESGVTGFKWRNPTAALTSSNINTVSLNVANCDTGVHLGDFANDGWHSNIDDNHFPQMHFYNVRHPLLVDSLAQDNNIIDRFDSGGIPALSGRTREYIIRTLNNGNGFAIGKAFIRADKVISDNFAIDIQRGSFSVENLSIEGPDLDIGLLNLGPFLTRDQSVIKNMYSTIGFRRSNGVSVNCECRSGALFLGCFFSGDLRVLRPIAAIGNIFADGYGVKLVGNLATIAELTLGTRSVEGGDINVFSNVHKATGFAPRLNEVATANIFPDIGKVSVNVKKNIDRTTSVNDPGYLPDRDLGREITFIISSDGSSRNVNWNASFKLHSGASTTVFTPNTLKVFKFIHDGDDWVESTTNA